MKKKLLTVLSIVLVLISMFLVGCSAQKTVNQEDSMQTSEEQQTQGENVEQNSLFAGTIFDNVILGKTSVQDVEKLLDDRILEYKNDTNESYCVSGKTTITDEFYQWKTLYRYIFNRVESEGDLVLTEWTAELLLNDDSEYKEAVKSIQSTIEKNALTEYTPLEAYYSDDIVEGAVTYYPIKKLKLNGIDAFQYIMFGKYANCDKEDAKHIVVLAVGLTSEENYQKGEIVKKTTRKVELETEELTIPPVIEEPKEMTDYVNIALFIADKDQIKGQCKSSFIISINKDTSEMKIVSISRTLYLKAEDDRYGKSSNAYAMGGAQQALKMLNSNLDMNIGDFVTINCKGLSEFVDALGGVWIDVNLDDWMLSDDNDKILMSLLETNEPIALNNGYQLLNGNQLAAYSWYMGRYDTSTRERQCEIIMAIHDQMQKVEQETLNQAVASYISNVYSSIDTEVIQNGMQNITNYSFTDSATLPQINMYKAVLLGGKGSCLVPTDLESNVVWLHQFLFNQDNYEVTSTVKEYSEKIKEDTAQYMAE